MNEAGTAAADYAAVAARVLRDSCIHLRQESQSTLQDDGPGPGTVKQLPPGAVVSFLALPQAV